MRFGVVGYSTRALVEAVVAHGYSAIAIDAFGDQDTLDLAAACYVVGGWPEGIEAAAEQVQVDGWLLAGGMENHPPIVAQLERRAPVLGAQSYQLQKLRDPAFWESIVAGIGGLGWPGCYEQPGPQRIFKPRLGSGGLHITQGETRTKDETRGEPLGLVGGYWQSFVAGRALGVSFVIDQRRVEHLGATESLSAQQWPGPARFIYRGSYGPIQLSPAQRAATLAMATRVATALPGYRGWLQADFIEDSQGALWLLELNPRWTAGMEVLQACAPRALTPLLAHLGCFGIRPNRPLEGSGRPGAFLKAVVYARRDMSLTRASRLRLQHWRAWQNLPGLPTQLSLADLPAVLGPDPVTFVSGSPILTVRLRK